jgi:hypothetical protein
MLFFTTAKCMLLIEQLFYTEVEPPVRKARMAGQDERQPKKRAGRMGRSLKATRSALGGYGDLFSAEERSSLSEALTAGDLTEEVALLRVLVHRAVESGESLETVSRALARLGQLLKVQHILSGDSERSLDDALARVLQEVGAEIGL